MRLAAKLSELESLLSKRWQGMGGSHRRLRPVETYGPRELLVREPSGLRPLINFSSNDYLGLSQMEQEVKLSSQPSSRLLGGNRCKVEAWEAEVATYWSKDSALFYPTGYMANVGVLSCLPQKGDLVLLDRLCHASLIDGVRLSSARWKRYRHLDMEHLESLLKDHDGAGTVWVVSESIFSMDGDCPDVMALRQLKERYGFILMVDEAHGVGVIGEGGRGFFEDQGALDLVDILMFNFSKTLALQGGCVLGVGELKRHLVALSRPQIYSTATPSSHWEALLPRMAAMESDADGRSHIARLKQTIEQGLGLQNVGPSGIIPLMIGDGSKALTTFEQLWEAGFFCPAVLPPTVPQGKARLRLSLNSSLRESDVNALLVELQKCL